MKILIGTMVACLVGAGCRYFDIPVPSPPVLPGALLVVAMTLGYSAIAAMMSQGPSGRAHERFIHAKGVVFTGTFQPSPGAAVISRAAHLAGGSVPVTVRFSDGAPDTTIPDTSPDASPRGMAIRFDALLFVNNKQERQAATR